MRLQSRTVFLAASQVNDRSAAGMDIPNVSSWRLNKAETKELENRVAGGEPDLEVKRGIQRRKATACEEGKKLQQPLLPSQEPLRRKL